MEQIHIHIAGWQRQRGAPKGTTTRRRREKYFLRGSPMPALCGRASPRPQTTAERAKLIDLRRPLDHDVKLAKSSRKRDPDAASLCSGIPPRICSPLRLMEFVSQREARHRSANRHRLFSTNSSCAMSRSPQGRTSSKSKRRWHELGRPRTCPTSAS